MSGTDTAIAELSEPAADPRPAPTVPRSAAVPYLTVSPAADAIDWYVDALGAVVVGEPFMMDDGRVGHAELALAGGVFYLADEYPEIGVKAPEPQAVSVSLMIEVADTDAALARAIGKGATVNQDAREAHGSRNATIIDPFGHRWMLSGPVTGATRSDPARRRRLCVGLDPGRGPRRGVLRPCPRVDVRPDHPSGDEHRAAHRDLQRRRPPGNAVLLRGDRPRRRATVDRRRWRDRRRRAGVRLRHGAGRHRPCRAPRSRCSSPRRARLVRNSMVLGQASFRTSPTKWRTPRRSGRSTAGSCSGRSNPVG